MARPVRHGAGNASGWLRRIALCAAMLGAPFASGAPVTGHLAGAAGAAAQHIALPAADGDYIEATLDSGAVQVVLDLVATDGRRQRRLLDGARGSNTVRFVAATGQQLQLSARHGSGDYRFEIVRQVPRERQLAPPDTSLSPRVAALARTLAAGGNTEAFWQAVAAEGTPLVEAVPDARDDSKRIVTFLWRGARHGVRLLGGPATDHDELQRLGDSDVWFRSYVVPADTRASYRLAPDVPSFDGSPRERRVAILATLQADPLNRHPWPQDAVDAFARESTFALPAAPVQPGLVPEQGQREVATGRLTKWQQTSKGLGNTRDITLYRPPGFNPADPATVLLFVFDAPQYLGKVPTPAILDNLRAAGRLPPVVAVFVDNADNARGRELPDNPDFARFMAEELLPRVARETGLKPDARRTVLAGSSYGGLASTSIALRYPQRFGNVLSMSGSYWWSPDGTPEDQREYTARRLLKLPKLPLRFFVSAGLFEGPHAYTAAILDTNRHLRDVLEARGYPVHYREYAGGHDYLVWRGALADGLLALFGNGKNPR
ncbi:enterochelin esterase [Uliginosibacterium sp. H1]|uniref:enterochelin esterase n=1 Tax=Uliginosibacterium sp. H1 TaxID=3114757 RepID=UPI002E184477|nr:enterochelin esterase [Uliginosibacterium sp. H1]